MKEATNKVFLKANAFHSLITLYINSRQLSVLKLDHEHYFEAF